MNRLGPTSPPPLTIEFTREEAEALATELSLSEDPVALQLLEILDTYLGE